MSIKFYVFTTGRYSSSWEFSSQSYGTSLAIWDHSVTCHPTQVNAPRRTRAIQAGSRFTYPGGMKGRVDLVDLIAPWLGVEPATFQSRVGRSTTAPPSNITDGIQTEVITVLHSMGHCAENEICRPAILLVTTPGPDFTISHYLSPECRGIKCTM